VDLFCVLQISLCLLQIVLCFDQIGFNVIQLLCLRRDKLGKFLEELKDLHDGLLEAQNGLILFFDVADGVFHFGVRLAHDLLLHQLFALRWIGCKFIELFLRGVLLDDFELFLYTVLHGILELGLDGLGGAEHVSESLGEGAMNSSFDSRFRLIRLLLHRLIDVVLHHVQVCLHRLENLLVVVDDPIQLVGFNLLVGRHVVMDFFLGDLAHLVVTLLANVQQALSFLGVGHESTDMLSVAGHFLIRRLVERLGQIQ